jgi:predicted DNA-binding transcriptional regulator AlpA
MNQKYPTKRYLTPKQVNEYCGIPEGTQSNWRSQKRGPKYYKISRKILYRIDDLDEWLTKNPVLTVDSLPEKKRG